jgi:transcriptional regulator with XRE-family HTH domain
MALTPKTRRKQRPGPDPVTGQLRAVINALGLTAYKVATDAGLAPSVVSRFLAGERSLSGELLDLVCASLGLRLVEERRAAARR